MGLFFNYDRPGPGVDKNAPRRWGIFLYFELLWRNFGKMLLSNMLYFAVTLPVTALYFVFSSYVFGAILPEGTDSVLMSQAAAVTALLMLIFLGAGPVSCGYTYIMRNTAREEHTFLLSDFFGKSRESFAHGLVFWLIDIVFTVCAFTAIWVYQGLARESGGIFSVLLFIMLLAVLIYISMHFYLYEFEVTFSGKISEIYKNSFMMALATLPMCLLIIAVIYFLSSYLLGFLSPLGVVCAGALCWVSFMRFAMDFYAARTIKRKLISRYEKEEA